MSKLTPQDERARAQLMTTSIFVSAQTLGASLAPEVASAGHPNVSGELALGTVGVTLRSGLLRSLARTTSLPDVRDLVKVIADSLRTSIQSLAGEVEEEEDQDALAVLAPSASAWWKSLFKTDTEGAVQMPLFSTAGEDTETERVLSASRWSELLAPVLEERQIEITGAALTLLTERLPEEFPASLHRLLTKDAANGDKAYPGLRPMLLAEIREALRDTAERPPLPTGTVTFLFTDLESSTRLWENFPQIMRASLMRHDALMKQAIESNRGHVFKQAGDAFYAVFATASDAVAAALTAQRQLLAETWDENVPMRVRMGLHTGEAQFRDNDYFGSTLNRVARLMSIGYGGQILLSQTTKRLVEGEMPEGASLKDMGSHRLKDLQQPEHVSQLCHPDLPLDFPPLKSQEVAISNLPPQLTSFVGRSKEIAEVKRLLKTTRLLTLSGGGGAGKTRLSLQVASELLQEEGLPVWMVELETVREVQAVPAAIALALNLPIRPGADLRQQVLDHLRPRRMLLLLDNFEQVADAAPFVSDLLRHCPELTCLISSREVLRISGEQEYQVQPLSLPPHDEPVADWSAFESVQLFVERCQSFKPDFALNETTAPAIGELCRRLDGIPLAIELAAARMRGMSPQQILQRLSRRLDLLASTQRDLPERQRTLRGAIDWSYDLLTEDERAIFSELAVFSGGFFLEAAEDVCLTPGAFDAVFSLRDKSLLKADEVNGETRYTTLESVRAYALEKLSDMNQLDVLRERHADYYLAQAVEWNEKLSGEQAVEAVEVFRREISNMREGMDWTARADSPEKTVAYGKALFTFLRRRGLYEEGNARLLTAQESAQRLGDRISEARLLNQRGLLAWDRSALDMAQRLFTASYQISEELDDKVRMLVTGINMGNVQWGRALFEEAREQWEQCLTLAVATSQPQYEGMLRTSLGILASYAGNYRDAQEYFETALSLQRQQNNTEGLAYTLYSSSEMLRRQGRHEEAVRRLEESQEIFQSLGHRQGIAESVVELGRNYLMMGRFERAEEYLDQGLQIAREIDDRRQIMYALEVQAQLLWQQGQIEAGRERFEASFRIAHEVGDRKQMAETLHHYSDMLWANGEIEQGFLILSIAEAESRRLGLVESDELRRKLANHQALLGDDAERILQRSSLLSLERLFESALSVGLLTA